jgi:hypothetical protein
MALDMTTWNRIQQDARAGKWGNFNVIRSMLCEEAARENPDDGIGSSDVNHMVFGLFENREEMTPGETMDELFARS